MRIFFITLYLSFFSNALTADILPYQNSNLSDDEYKKAILGTGFEVVKVITVDKFIDDPGEAVSVLAD